MPVFDETHELRMQQEYRQFLNRKGWKCLICGTGKKQYQVVINESPDDTCIACGRIR